MLSDDVLHFTTVNSSLGHRAQSKKKKKKMMTVSDMFDV